jgi:polysaccharide biosynthesis protein PslH
MVNVTWITPYAPDRSGGGGQIRQAHLLLALATRARIELICPGPVADPDVRSAVARLVEVAPVTSSWREHRWLRRAADLGATAIPLVARSRQPMEVRALRPMRRVLGSAVGGAGAGADADLVLVEFSGLAPLLPGWSGRPQRSRSAGGRPWVLTFHNLPSRMAAQQALVMPRRRQRWFLARDAAVAATFERRACEAFDAVIACTAEDAAALAGKGHVIVVPNGADVAGIQPTPLPPAPRIVFVGALYTTPNIDGARWFCEEVLPRIQAQEPAAMVDLVGARPVAEVRSLARLPGVSVHPDVETVMPYLQAARVAVVPIRVGSGTRLKALEAMAAGRPVVGTSIGLEGLNLRAGEHALVADDAGAFGDAVVRLLRDDDFATKLAVAGRAEVEAHFAWPSIAAAFAAWVLARAGSDGAGPAGDRRDGAGHR